MSTDLVVQLGARLDQFASDLNQAGNMADDAISRIEQSFANLNPGLGGFGSLGLSIAGVTGSVGALLTVLSSVNGQLADIQKNADFSGISTDRFQQIQFAAGQSGIGNDQSATDLANVAKLLADANYNENSLTKLLDENNIKYKDRNGQIISLNQLLTVAGDLLGRFDSIPDKTKAAQMLGLSQGWVDALHSGSAAFEAVAQSANDAGVIIDSQTIAKAALFDQAWKASSATLSAEFKAVTADIAVYLDGLIDKANSFITSLNLSSGIAPGSGQDKFNATADALDIVRKDAQGAAQDVDQLTRVIDRMNASGTGDPAIIAGLEEMRAKAQLALQLMQQVNDEQSKAAYPSGVPLPAARPAAADTPTGDGKLPQRGGDAKDTYDRATESVTKYTARLQAEADALGQGAGATEEAKAAAQLLTAAQQAGIPITQKVRDQMQDLAQDAGAAALALAKAKVANDISRGQQTAFLSPEDVTIANQLNDIYPNVAQALDSVEASALRGNQAISGASTAISNDLTSGLTDITTGAKTAQQGFSDMAQSILKDIEQMIIKLYIVGPLMRSLQSGFASFLPGTGAINANGSIVGAIGPTSVGGAPLVYDGGGYTGPGGKYQPAGIVHKGEVVWSQDDVAKAGGVGVVEAMRRGLPGLASGGVAGQVTPVLSRGSNGGPTFNLVVENHGADVQQSDPKKNSSGGIDVKMVIRQQVNSDITSGYHDKALKARVGASPVQQKR